MHRCCFSFSLVFTFSPLFSRSFHFSHFSSTLARFSLASCLVSTCLVALWRLSHGSGKVFSGFTPSLAHLGISMMPRRSTLSDANSRRPEYVFECIYRSLYNRYKGELSSDSRKRQVPSWLKRLQIIDSTTISLFLDLIFKGVGRHPKSGKKKGGIKVHTNIHANEGVPLGHQVHLGSHQ